MSSVLRTTRTPTTRPRITSTDSTSATMLFHFHSWSNAMNRPGAEQHRDDALADDQRAARERRQGRLLGGLELVVVLVVLEVGVCVCVGVGVAELEVVEAAHRRAGPSHRRPCRRRTACPADERRYDGSSSASSSASGAVAAAIAGRVRPRSVATAVDRVVGIVVDVDRVGLISSAPTPDLPG